MRSPKSEIFCIFHWMLRVYRRTYFSHFCKKEFKYFVYLENWLTEKMKNLISDLVKIELIDLLLTYSKYMNNRIQISNPDRDSGFEPNTSQSLSNHSSITNLKNLKDWKQFFFYFSGFRAFQLFSFLIFIFSVLQFFGLKILVFHFLNFSVFYSFLDFQFMNWTI